MPGQDSSSGRLRWLEWIKAIALVLIVFNHALERMGEYPFIANPSADWEPLAERVDQLAPTTGSLWDLAFNVFRYLGLFGEVGVQLFIIASGLGLMLAAGRRGGVDSGFAKRRVERVAPTWLVVHGLALLASIPILVFIGGGAAELVAAPWDPRFWASLVGFRITPETIYYLVPAWWFIALLIQLYLAFPLIYRAFETYGRRTLWWVMGGGVVIKLAGLLVFDAYLDTWARGAIFVTRLPEFAFGMLVAVWLVSDKNLMQTRRALVGAAIAIPIGIASSLTLAGNAWGPFLFGAGLFVLLYRVLSPLNGRGRFAVGTEWVGRHSLALFIVHQPIFHILMPGGMAGPARVIGGFLVAAALTVVAALILEWIVARGQRTWKKWAEAGVLGRRGAAIAVLCFIAYGALVVGDAWVRSNDPQEVLGWGERPSLEEDAELGWKLIPSQATRLQWQSYDYLVSANDFGFAGPLTEPDEGDLRILTLGDAFTSAEGVDTERSWPRLLEDLLGSEVTVWNGAVTGYGPPQYATVAQRLVPVFDPDVVVVGFFVNDFFDSEADLDETTESIGFGRPDPTGPIPTLQWAHLSKYLRYHVTEPLLATLGIPNRTGYLLGHFGAFEPGEIEIGSPAYELALESMQKVRNMAPDARLIMMLVPASIQVCTPDDLEYYPDNVDLADFDLDQPQRVAVPLAQLVGAEVVDLRDPLRTAGDCPYQPGNMHWLDLGHEIAARQMATHLGN